MTTLSPTPPVLNAAAALQAAGAAEPVPPAATTATTTSTGSGSPFSAVLSGLDPSGTPAEGITASASTPPIRELVPALFAVTDDARQGTQLPGIPALADPESGETLPLDGQSLPSGNDATSPGIHAEQYTDPGFVLTAGMIEGNPGPLPVPALPSPLAISTAAADDGAPLASPAVSNAPALPTAIIEAGVQSDSASAPATGLQTTVSARDAAAAFDLTMQQAGPDGNSLSIDTPLPVDTQSRLHTMMAALDRALPGPDPMTTPLSGVPAGSSPAGAVGTAPATALTPVFTGLPILEPGADQQAWAQGLGERLLMMAEKGQQSATLRLQPEQLGPLQIHIRVDEDGASQVLFSAHHAQTREAIEQAMPRLRELFAEQGLNLAQADVDSGRGTFTGREFASSPWGDGAHAADPEPGTGDHQRATLWQLGPSSRRRLDVLA